MRQKILDSLNVNVYWKNKDGAYLGCNKQLSKLVHLDHTDDIVGKTIFDFVGILGKKVAKKVHQEDQSLMKEGATKTYEEIGVDNLGNKRTYLTHKKSIFDKKRNVIGMIGISFDISLEKENLDLKAKLSSSLQKNQTLKSLGSSIAHEMRTPLASLDGSLEFVIESIKKNENPDDVIEHLHWMKDKIKRTNDVINLILHNLKFNNIDPAKFKMINIGDCINLAIKDFPYDKNLSNIVSFGYFESFDILASEDLCKLVLINIFKNSLYALSETSNKKIEISTMRKKNKVLLVIKDNGQGIEQDILPYIFDEFFTTKPLSTGTGLGLYFCKNVVESFKGKIYCESKHAEYTKMILQFTQ